MALADYVRADIIGSDTLLQWCHSPLFLTRKLVQGNCPETEFMATKICVV